MKALNLYGIKDVRYEDIAKPEIESANDVIIKVKITGVCGSDISRFGKIGPYNPGLTWGHEFSGIIEDIGSNVTSLKVGDRVTACNCFPCYQCIFCEKSQFSKCVDLKVLGGQIKGSFAEYIKVPSSNVVKLPDSLDFEAASLVEPSSVVVHGLNKITIHAGNKVAVVGCGTIGLLAVQWAKLFGAGEVYAFDTEEQKLDVAKQTGADHTFNVSDSNYTARLDALTNGLGVDVVIDSSGSVGGIASALTMAMKGGTVLLLGIPYGDVMLPRNTFEKIIRNELNVVGSWNSMSAPFPGDEWKTSVAYMDKKLLNVRPLITHRVSLEQAPELFHKLYAREFPFIKVLIQC